MMFAKINESVIVNLDHIVWMDDDKVKLTDGTEHVVSSENVESLQKLMKFSNKATERIALGNF